MRAAGLDIGSRTVELAVVDGAGALVHAARIDTTPALGADCARLLGESEYDVLLVTGYGRALAEVHFAAPTVTEIKAHARGAWALHPGCRTVLDIGGQDTKVIALDERGRVAKFEMNDRCAAGAGKFLEMMAAALGYAIGDFGTAALAVASDLKLSSMCAVFAESEVIGLVTQGRRREEIARAVHEAIHRRTLAMLRRLGAQGPLCFCGGAARNPCLVRLLEVELQQPVHVPADPDMVGAYGAALLAAERA
jgi:(R)-2-hydroxyacyl-CoA dehydratese activating ATPase